MQLGCNQEDFTTLAGQSSSRLDRKGSSADRFPRRGRWRWGRVARARAVLPLAPAELQQRSPNSPSAPYTSSIHPCAGGAKQTGLQSPAQRHIVRSRGSYLGLRARPGGGPSGAGAARGEAQRAAATRAGEGRGRPPSPRGRQRRDSPAGHSAAARLVLLLGRRRRLLLLQPSSQRRAAPGVRSTFSCSFPHTTPREGSLAHTRARPQTARSFRKIRNSGSGGKGVTEERTRQRCADLSVPSERQTREGRADAGGARPTQFVRRSHSARRPRRPGWHLRADPAAWGGRRQRPLLTFRVPRPRWNGDRCPPQDWLKARAGAWGSGEV